MKPNPLRRVWISHKSLLKYHEAAEAAYDLAAALMEEREKWIK